MAALITILSIPVTIASLACWIMTIVKAFQKEESPLIGILSICGCIGFIMGWVNVEKWDHKNIMVIWSACIVLGIILNVVQLAVAGG